MRQSDQAKTYNIDKEEVLNRGSANEHETYAALERGNVVSCLLCIKLCAMITENQQLQLKKFRSARDPVRIERDDRVLRIDEVMYEDELNEEGLDREFSCGLQIDEECVEGSNEYSWRECGHDECVTMKMSGKVSWKGV
jgi:hypothetical protein